MFSSYPFGVCLETAFLPFIAADCELNREMTSSLRLPGESIDKPYLLRREFLELVGLSSWSAREVPLRFN